MEVKLLTTLPQNLTSKPRTYETRYVYTGFGKYDTERRMIILTQRLPNGNYKIIEAPHDPHVISRGYHTEHIRVNVYQEHPRIWSEELSPHMTFYYAQNPQQ